MTDLHPTIDPAALASLGEGHVAYVRPMSAAEVKRLFPQAPDLSPGLSVFALLSASGAPILLTDSRDAAIANAWAHDLQALSVH
ncbi:BQ00720 family protein [Methylobacterium sp. JK268]